MVTLSHEFEGKFFPHNESYWKEWSTSIYPHQPNGFATRTPYGCYGNALFRNKEKFQSAVWTDLGLDTGNHAVLVECKHIRSNRTFRIANIHLDGDSMEQRKLEYSTILDNLPYDPNIIDIVVLTT